MKTTFRIHATICITGIFVGSLLCMGNSQAQYKKANPLDSKFGLKSVWMESSTIEPSGFKGGPAAAPVRKPIPMTYSRFKTVHSAAQWDAEQSRWYGNLQEFLPHAKFEVHRADGRTGKYSWTESADAVGAIADTNLEDEVTSRQFRLSAPGNVVLTTSSWIDATDINPSNPYSYSKMTIKWHPKFEAIKPSNIVSSTTYQASKGVIWPAGTTGALTPGDAAPTTIVKVVQKPVPQSIKVGTQVLEYTVGYLSGGGPVSFTQTTSPWVGATAGAFGVWLGKNKPEDITASGVYDYEMWARSVHADQTPRPGEPQFISINPPSAIGTLSTPGKTTDLAWAASSATKFGLRNNMTTNNWSADEYGDKGYIGPANGTRTRINGAPTVMGFFTVAPY